VECVEGADLAVLVEGADLAVDMAAVALEASAVLADSAVAPMALARMVALLHAVLDLGRTALLVVSDVGVAEAMARCPT